MLRKRDLFQPARLRYLGELYRLTTLQIPSSAYLGAALASVALSVDFKIAKKDHMALFIGQWAAPFLILGTYNNFVKAAWIGRQHSDYCTFHCRVGVKTVGANVMGTDSSLRI